MPSLRIEHVNIAVADPERTSGLMEALFGWHVRWRGRSQSGAYVTHVGTDDHYLALVTRPDTADIADAFAKGRPLNHIGVEVDDLDATEARVRAAGLIPFNHADYEPGHRFYFNDPDGIEYEIVSYSNGVSA
jgi:catechol 2,3-dioxygenase-like lactoylglutathione lyase family enzyme